MAKEIKWVIDEKGCHICTSHAKDKNGYAKLKKNHRSWQMHRYIYTQHYGEISKGLVVMHSCDNPSCINIEHLSLGTPKDNNADMIKKGRWDPSKCGPKLTKRTIATPNIIRELRKEKGLSGKFIAESIGIDASYFYKIERHKTNGSINVLTDIARFLDTDLTNLFKEE